MGANVPAGGIYTARDIAEDPHYLERDNIVSFDDEREGSVAMPNVVPKLRGTPGQVRAIGPDLGQHNELIYSGILGHSNEQLQQWREQGII